MPGVHLGTTDVTLPITGLLKIQKAISSMILSSKPFTIRHLRASTSQLLMLLPGHTTFFPATGLRYRYDGKLYYTGQAGAYWSAIPFMTFGALSLYLDKASVLPVGCPNRSYGYAVRPVRD